MSAKTFVFRVRKKLMHLNTPHYIPRDADKRHRVPFYALYCPHFRFHSVRQPLTDVFLDIVPDINNAMQFRTHSDLNIDFYGHGFGFNSCVCPKLHQLQRPVCGSRWQLPLCRCHRCSQGRLTFG